MLNVTMINRPCGIAYACSKLFMLCSAASKNRASGSHTRLLVKKHQNKLHQRWKCKEIGYLTITFFFYAISLSWKAIKSVIQWGIGGGRSSFYSILFMWVKCVYLRWLPRKALGSSSGAGNGSTFSLIFFHSCLSKQMFFVSKRLGSQNF